MLLFSRDCNEAIYGRSCIAIYIKTSISMGKISKTLNEMINLQSSIYIVRSHLELPECLWVLCLCAQTQPIRLAPAPEDGWVLGPEGVQSHRPPCPPGISRPRFRQKPSSWPPEEASKPYCWAAALTALPLSSRIPEDAGKQCFPVTLL